MVVQVYMTAANLKRKISDPQQGHEGSTVRCHEMTWDQLFFSPWFFSPWHQLIWRIRLKQTKSASTWSPPVRPRCTSGDWGKKKPTNQPRCHLRAHSERAHPLYGKGLFPPKGWVPPAQRFTGGSNGRKVRGSRVSPAPGSGAAARGGGEGGLAGGPAATCGAAPSRHRRGRAFSRAQLHGRHRVSLLQRLLVLLLQQLVQLPVVQLRGLRTAGGPAAPQVLQGPAVLLLQPPELGAQGLRLVAGARGTGLARAGGSGTQQGLAEEAAVLTAQAAVLQPQARVLLAQPRVVPLPLLPLPQRLAVASGQVRVPLRQLLQRAPRLAPPAVAAAARLGELLRPAAAAAAAGGGGGEPRPDSPRRADAAPAPVNSAHAPHPCRSRSPPARPCAAAAAGGGRCPAPAPPHAESGAGRGRRGRAGAGPGPHGRSGRTGLLDGRCRWGRGARSGASWCQKGGWAACRGSAQEPFGSS